MSRPDVAEAFPGFGPYHGYDANIPLPVGVHQVCVTAINTGPGATNRSLGCLPGSGAGPRSSFVPTTPTRVLDSRDGTGGYSTPWSADQTRALTVAGAGPVPADATAVVMNVTVTNPTAPSFVTVSPTGGLVPVASNLNFVTGQTIPNLVTVQTGAGGKIDLTNHSGRTDLVIDVVGYYTTGAGDLFTAVTPTRVLDSRNGTGGYPTPWGAGQTRPLTVTGTAGIPPGATAVVMNVTVTNPSKSSWLRVSPTGTPPPLASNLNFVAGQTIPNLVTVKVGAGGKVDITNLTGHTDVIADIVGYFTPTTGSGFVPLAPARVLDSRTGTGGYSTPWGAAQTRPLTVTGPAGIPPAPPRWS